MTTENATAAPPTAPHRLHSLDSLRAVMMFLGIILHATLPYLPGDPSSGAPFFDTSAQSPAYVLVVLFIHTFRMPVFFVMAGFFAALLQKRRGSRGLLSNRFQRIAIPFAVGWIILFPLVEGTGVFLRSGGGGVGLRAVMGALVSGRLYAKPTPSYLWFLYYLLMFYPLGLACSWLLGRLGQHARGFVHEGFRRAMQSELRPALFAIPTAITLWPMATGVFDTPSSFWPDPAILAAYAVFFGFGWILYSHLDLLPGLSRHAWKQVCLAVILVPLNLLAVFSSPPGQNPAAHWLVVLTSALIVWLFVFGITGLFIRYFDRSLPWMRYLTDSSYWCYLAHLPVIYWFAALIAPLPFPSPVKVLSVIVLTMASILLAYHLGVRSTLIGVGLNGRRYPFWPRRTADGDIHPSPARAASPLADSHRPASELVGSAEHRTEP